MGDENVNLGDNDPYAEDEYTVHTVEPLEYGNPLDTANLTLMER